MDSYYSYYSQASTDTFVENNKRWSLLHDPDKLFELDAANLELKHMLNNESGIGEVWVGELTEPSGIHRVAVKKYPSAFADEEYSMFRRETGVLFMAASRCHNVCKVYGTTVKEGKMCIVMKLYKESMAALVRRQPAGRLPMHEIRRYGGDICKAVAELHEQNIILQDLKPPNILLDDYDHCGSSSSPALLAPLSSSSLRPPSPTAQI
jgi:serine/threonine protein kinase